MLPRGALLALFLVARCELASQTTGDDWQNVVPLARVSCRRVETSSTPTNTTSQGAAVVSYHERPPAIQPPRCDICVPLHGTSETIREKQHCTDSQSLEERGMKR